MPNKKQIEGKVKASKEHGRIYTPDYLVSLMLDFIGYKRTEDIIQHHIIDNSCGDGAFLCGIVTRYCIAWGNQPKAKLRLELQEYIHGIELDPQERNLCISNLNKITEAFGLKNVDWDVICGDTLTIHDYDHKMDYVVGNPPYVRVHNLNDSYDAVKQYKFAQQGMTDLFIVFFEIGFNMLSQNGQMCLITPSSWLASNAGSILRKHIMLHKNMSGCIDLGHFQAFNATTYTLISKFNKRINHSVNYYTYDGNKCNCKGDICYEKFCIDNKFYFATKESLEILKSISNNVYSRKVIVKNGFATLADKIFFGDFAFKDCVINVIKASTGSWTKAIFPYDIKGKVLEEEQLNKFSDVYEYLLSHKEYLLKGRKADKNSHWYQYGRSQAINDVSKNKIAINSIIKDINSIKLNYVKSGEGVYSGLYILTDLPYKEIADIILSRSFIEYITSLKKYKSGGYYTFSSSDLEHYINYKIQTKNGQSGFSKNCNCLF